MKHVYLAAVLGTMICAHARADGALQMTGPDSATAMYDDHCSNGANVIEKTRTQFINNMLANPQSKLGSVTAQLATVEDGIQATKGVLTKWVQTYHMRMGCGTNQNSFSAIIQSYDTMSNSHVTVSKYLVTVDDDDESGTRTLKLRDIQPLNVRQED
ncbi:MAG: hypothetical protein ABIR96_10160 [Bdellovibrionota bacterium]